MLFVIRFLLLLFNFLKLSSASSYSSYSGILPLADDCQIKEPVFCGFAVTSHYRTADGSCNNVVNDDPTRSHWGQSYTCYPRLLVAQYGDFWGNVIRLAHDGGQLPNARLISNVFLKQEYYSPDVAYSQVLLYWGQLVSNEISITAGLFPELDFDPQPCCDPNPKLPPFPDCLAVSFKNDAFFSPFGYNCINMIRHQRCENCQYAQDQQLNVVTSFLDAGVLYGSTLNQTLNLRVFKNGQLRLSADNLLIDLGKDEPGRCGMRYRKYYPNQTDISCFRAGNPVINQNPFRATLVNILARQHNRIALMLQSVNQFYTDEQLFQETRRIIIAQMQTFTYSEFLPALLGKDVMEGYDLLLTTNGFTDYNHNVNPSTATEFGAAFFAVLDTMVSYDSKKQFFNGVEVPVPVRDYYYFNLGFHDGEIDNYFLGMSRTPIEAVDAMVDDDVRNYAFKIAKNNYHYGIDVVVENIQKSRSDGVAGYTFFRKHCFDHKVYSFNDLTGLMSKKSILQLSTIYQHYEDIDLYLGVLLEYPLPGALIGPTAACIIGTQFYRNKYGDRYYFEHGGVPGGFTLPQLNNIRETTLAKMACETSDKFRNENIQKYAMRLPSKENSLVPCSSLPDIDISLFKQNPPSSKAKGDLPPPESMNGNDADVQNAQPGRSDTGPVNDAR